MNNVKIPTVSADFLNTINTSIPFMVWGRPGYGMLHHVKSHFETSDYHVHRVIASNVSPSDVDAIPVLTETGVAFKEANWLSGLNNIRDVDGKKIVLIFDDITSSSASGAKVFSKAVMHREVLGFTLAEDDIVVGMGMLDSNGSPMDSLVPSIIYNHMVHYAPDLSHKAA